MISPLVYSNILNFDIVEAKILIFYITGSQMSDSNSSFSGEVEVLHEGHKNFSYEEDEDSEEEEQSHQYLVIIFYIF